MMQRIPALPVLVLLLGSPAFAQQQLAPYGTPSSPSEEVAASSRNGSQSAGVPTDDFEAYVVSAGGAENIGVLALDDTTVTGTGQGPGLVADGCTYSCTSNTLQWNGDGYFGLTTKTFLGNTGDGDLWLSYDSPTTTVDFELMAFDGFSDTAVVNVFDSAGSLIHSSSSIALPDSTPVPWSFSGTDIAQIQIDGQVWPWSPVLDNHDYDAAPAFSIRLTGTCPGPMTVEIENATPSGTVHVAYAFGTGAFTIPGGFPCAGTTLGLSGTGITLAATLTADGAGSATLPGNAPAGACGNVWIQALDEATCSVSNVAGL